MKKVLVIVSVVLIAAFCIIGVLWRFTDLFGTESASDTKGILLDAETNAESAYSMEILKYNDIEDDFVRRWIDKYREDGIAQDGSPVYYTLHNDPTLPFKMYLFMPEAKTVMGDITLSNITVREWGSAIVLNIDTKDNIGKTKDGTDMILYLYATGTPETIMGKSEQLVINGVVYTCPSASFTRFE